MFAYQNQKFSNIKDVIECLKKHSNKYKQSMKAKGETK